jgi:hypothetical protein
VLSFEALRSLVVTLGLSSSIAWLWPCAIDVAIAQATLCLLSLSRRTVVAEVDVTAAEPVSTQNATRVDTPKNAPVKPAHPAPAAKSVPNRRTSSVRIPSLGDLVAAVPACADTADILRWQPVAESLVREGVTAKDSRLVATILAQHEAGVPPSTIGRIHKVHHTTVGRILSAAQELTA